MIKRIYYQNKQVLRAFLGDKIIISIAPKLSANFISGEYKQDGAPCSFTDLFTFTRAGKAWLVRETGLQEYAADVPRLDDGLLIEQESTNISPNINKYSAQGGGTKEQLDDGYMRFNKGTGGGLIYVYPPYLKDTLYMYSLYVRAVINTNAAIITQGSTYSKSHTLVALEKKLLTLGLLRAGGASHVGLNASSIDVLYAQLETGERATTPVITDRTPVTRPADFLTSKITGTTVTGDWDSTLTLSIVNGQLQHSGYGKIRILEIR